MNSRKATAHSMEVTIHHAPSSFETLCCSVGCCTGRKLIDNRPQPATVLVYASAQPFVGFCERRRRRRPAWHYQSDKTCFTNYAPEHIVTCAAAHIKPLMLWALRTAEAKCFQRRSTRRLIKIVAFSRTKMQSINTYMHYRLHTLALIGKLIERKARQGEVQIWFIYEGTLTPMSTGMPIILHWKNPNKNGHDVTSRAFLISS